MPDGLLNLTSMGLFLFRESAGVHCKHSVRSNRVFAVWKMDGWREKLFVEGIRFMYVGISWG